MASQTQPKADQPRVTTENLKRGEKPASLSYRNTATNTVNNRSLGRKDYGRLGRN
jgi:hypothetical protein